MMPHYQFSLMGLDIFPNNMRMVKVSTCEQAMIHCTSPVYEK